MAEGASTPLLMCLLFLLTICISVYPLKQFKEKELKRGGQIYHYSHRQLLHKFHYKATQHDTLYPPTTTLPTTPVTVSPETNPTPTIVTVPSTNPSSTPATVPSTNPVNPLAAPTTNPVTTPGTVPGAQPVTNPVTTYQPPSTGVPATTPVTNPVPPPATTGPPAAVTGQSWCVAKSGSGDSSLQAALDYACGIGGADCSAIQQGSSCYNPNSLQNHASYAFNSYYQKHPAQTSCDFGGTATITNINPSTGTCIYPSSSSPSSSPPTTTTPSTSTPPTTTTTPTPTTPTPPTTTPTPMTPTPPTTTPTPTTATPTPTTATPTPTTPPSSGGTFPVYGSPPAVMNSSNPASGTTGFGENPPTVSSSTSMATILQPFTGCIITVISVVTGRFILEK